MLRRRGPAGRSDGNGLHAAFYMDLYHGRSEDVPARRSRSPEEGMATNMIAMVELTRFPVERRPVLTNLMQLYLHDFSEFAAIGTPYGEVGADGRFGYERLESYWETEERMPLAIEADGRPAGFVLVNRWSALDRPLDHAVAEFFVLRKYRRHGVGSRAARRLFASFPGRWEVAVAAYNRPALLFWRAAIRAATGREAAEVAGDGRRWTGTVFCFENEADTR